MTVCKWMKGLLSVFPMIYAEVWVGGGGAVVLVSILVFLTFTGVY